MLQPYLVSADVPYCLTPLLLCSRCWRCPEVTTGLHAEFCHSSHARHSITSIHISSLHPLLDRKLSEDRHCVALAFVPWLPSSAPGTQHTLNNKLDILPTVEKKKKKSSPFWSVISFLFRRAGDMLISIALVVFPCNVDLNHWIAYSTYEALAMLRFPLQKWKRPEGRMFLELVLLDSSASKRFNHMQMSKNMSLEI